MSQLTLKCEKFGLSRGLHDLLSSGDLVDLTLACQGQFIQAHKTVLAACSPHFRTIFSKMNPWQHPIVYMHNIEVSQLQALVDFMYNGEVTVNQEDLPGFLKLADELKVSGLAEQNKEEQSKLPDNESLSSSPPAKIARRSCDVDISSSLQEQHPDVSDGSQHSWTPQTDNDNEILLPEEIKIEDVQEENIDELDEHQELISTQECGEEARGEEDSVFESKITQPSTSSEVQLQSLDQESQPADVNDADEVCSPEGNDNNETKDKLPQDESSSPPSPPASLFPCTKCHHKFSSITKLQNHFEKIHQDKKEEKKEIRNPKTDSQNPRTRYVCRMCPKDFSHQSVRIRHELEVHKVNINNPGKVFQCNLCPRVFSSKTLLSNHSSAHMKM